MLFKLLAKFASDIFPPMFFLLVFLFLGEFFGGHLVSRLVPLGMLGVFALLIGIIASLSVFDKDTARPKKFKNLFLTLTLSASSMIIVWFALAGTPRLRTEGTILAGILFASFFSLVFYGHENED